MIEMMWWQFALLLGASGSVGAMLTDAIRHKKEVLREKRWQDRYLEKDKKYLRQTQRAEHFHAKLRRLEDTIDEVVEERLQKRIREWEPAQGDIDADFRKAEQMAAKRDAINAGRSHPPRKDGGEPAKIHEISFRNDGSNR